MSDARTEILARIARARQAHGPDHPRLPPPPDPPQSLCDDPTALFAARVRDYGARLHFEGATGRLSDKIDNALSDCSSKLVVVPSGFPLELLPPHMRAIEDDGRLTPHDLDTIDACVSLCALAIAETGTVVLDGGQGQGRRALSLIPDQLVCIVRPEQLASSVAEAISRLEGAVRAGRPITFISGPSATSDIELIRVEGVHGPRQLDVIVRSGQCVDLPT